MNYWWVNHGGSFENENNGGFLWAPLEGRVFHENVKRVKKGDFVFSYARKHIRAIGVAIDNPIKAKNPTRIGDNRIGNYVKIYWTNLDVPFRTFKIWEQTKHLFRKCRNAPLTETGKGCQGYLYQITKDIFYNYCSFIQKCTKTDLCKFIDCSETIEISNNDISNVNNFEEVYIEPIEDEEDIETDEMNFTYERDLQNALVLQIDKLFPQYNIFGDNKEGVEYSVEGKRIDVLLENKINKNELLAIELKAGLAKKEVLGQISEYLGKLMKKFPEKKVNGIIIASEIDEGLKDACLPFQNIKTMKYKIELTLFE